MKKILSIFIAAVLIVGCTPVFALDASNQHDVVDGQGTSDIVIESAEAVQLTITVPVQLPMAVSADGSTTVADNAKIINKSYSPVKVSTYSIEGKDGWQLVDETHDFSKDNVGTKNFSLTLSENVYDVINGRSEQPFTYDGKISGQKAALDNAVIGTVLWNIGWNGETGGTGGGTGGSEEPDPAPAPEKEILQPNFTPDASGKLTFTDTGAATIKKGDTAHVEANGLDPDNTTWDSSNKTVATITDDGDLTAQENGTSTIKAEDNNNEMSFELTVENGKITYTNFTITASNRKAVGYTGAEDENLEIPATFVGDGSNGTKAGTNYKVVEIGMSAFNGCSSLASVVIPEGISNINAQAFYGCSSLTSVTLPDSITSIGDSAFYGCSSLTSVTIPDGVRYIESSAFMNCSKLTEISIPDGVNSIYHNTFKNCSSLTSVNFLGSVASIEDSAFYGCSSLTSITLPDSITSIGMNAFERCSKLTAITIPDGVERIEQGTFSDCSALTEITLPNNVTSIGQLAFSGCYRLASITISNKMENIESRAFYDCSSLRNITYTGTKEEWNAITVSSSSGLSGKTIHCSDGDITA